MKIKRVLIILILLFPLKVMSQISFLDNTNKGNNITVKYDSLTNIKNINDNGYNHLIGQTLIYSTKKSIYYDLVYQESMQKVPEIVGSEFNIIDVIPPSDYSGRYRMNLIENRTGNKCYLYIYSDAINSDWTIKGYYEKMQQLYVGKKFRYLNKCTDYGLGSTTDDLINLEKGYELNDIPFCSEWECTGISIKMKRDELEKSRRPLIVLIFKNLEYGECYAYLENLSGFDFYSKEVQISNEIKSKYILGKFLLEDDFFKRKSFLTNKYGKTNADLILKHIVRIGMSPKMVEESWGKPDDINKTSGSFGTHEQWIYNEQYLYFENGKLTTIQD